MIGRFARCRIAGRDTDGVVFIRDGDRRKFAGRRVGAQVRRPVPVDQRRGNRPRGGRRVRRVGVGQVAKQRLHSVRCGLTGGERDDQVVAIVAVGRRNDGTESDSAEGQRRPIETDFARPTALVEDRQLVFAAATGRICDRQAAAIEIGRIDIGWQSGCGIDDLRVRIDRVLVETGVGDAAQRWRVIHWSDINRHHAWRFTKNGTVTGRESERGVAGAVFVGDGRVRKLTTGDTGDRQQLSWRDRRGAKPEGATGR